MDRTIRIAAAALGAAFITASAACSSGSPSPGSGMMGGSDTSYHYATLTCAAPSSLPGRTVTVTLADMGMTQMMGGTAPMGAHMMLRTAPATVAAGQITFVAQNMGWRTHELVILPLDAGAQTGQRVPGPDDKVRTEEGQSPTSDDLSQLSLPFKVWSRSRLCRWFCDRDDSVGHGEYLLSGRS